MKRIRPYWQADFERLGRLPDQLDLKDAVADIYAVGPGYGESVVVVVGKRIVFGVDCCNGLVMPDLSTRKSLLQRICSVLPRSTVAIWGLSHPHHDHFQGISEFTKMMLGSLSRFVLPLEYTARDIRDQCAQALVNDPTLNKIYLRRIRDRFIQFCDDVTVSSVEKSTAIEEVVVWETKLRYKGLDDIPFSIRVIAPSRNHYDVLKQRGIQMAGLFQHASKKTGRAYANDGSAVYLVQIGSFRILLCGDAPCQVTKNALRKTPGFPHSRVYLKVAHHGSLTATDQEFLEHLWTNSRGQLAVICPFFRDGLPDPELISLLKKNQVQKTVTGEISSQYARLLIRKIGKAGARRIKNLISGEGSVSHVRIELVEPETA